MPPSRKKPSNKFDSMRRIFFFSILGLLGVGLLYLFRPFFYPIFWAAVIAVMFYPLYKFLGKYITKNTQHKAYNNTANKTLRFSNIIIVCFYTLIFEIILAFHYKYKLK